MDGKMVHQVKVFALCKPDEPRLIPGTLVQVEGEDRLHGAC